MDIKTEREAFEAWYCRNHTGLKQSDLAKFRTLSGYSFSDSLKINISWEAWQAAKAQAVPEGFVLVSKEIPDSVVDRLRYSSYHWGDGTRDYFTPVYQMIIEAQEPTND